MGDEEIAPMNLPGKTSAPAKAIATPKQATIIIDERESREYDSLLTAAGCETLRQTLSIGDFILSEKLAAERKSRADFEASIIDGRLFEQAARLAATYARVVLIVEGERERESGEGQSPSSAKNLRTGRVGRSALLGAYSALVSDMGISLFFTKNPAATAELLAALARHDQLAKKVPLRVMAKQKSLTLEQSQRAMIEALPGIGPQMARRLLAHFGTPSRVFSSNVKELEEVQGLGPKKARQIRLVLDSTWEKQAE